MSKKQVCPECSGNKIIPGSCVCDMEWRGTQTDEGMEDCQCEPDVSCSRCGGTGEIEEQ